MERFWSKTEPEPMSGCLIWAASVDARGYGRFLLGEKSRRAHRVSWEMCRGAIPAGSYVLHKCDNPSCVNPEHLFTGTQADNMRDMYRKGRRAQKSGFRLTSAEIEFIRSSPHPSRQVAAELGVSKSLVNNVRRHVDT